MKPTALVAALFLPVAASAQQAVDIGSGAVLRGLDKVDGQTTDMELEQGGATEIGRLRVELRQCRYPAGAPASDAFAYLVIRDAETGIELFSGWMVASSPALNALEHPRYDVWVLRCKTG